MNAFAAPETCTAHQRQFVRVLLSKLDLSAVRFSYQHRIPWKTARLPEPEFDADIDANLRGLSKLQASALIRALKAQAGEDVEDDS